MQEGTGNTGRTLGNIPLDQVKRAVMRGYQAAHPGTTFNALPLQKQESIIDQVIDHFASGQKGSLADTAGGVSPEIKALEPYVLSELRKVEAWDEDLYVAGFNTTAPAKDVGGTEADAR